MEGDMLTFILARWATVKAIGWAGALAWGRSRLTSTVTGAPTQAAVIAAVAIGLVVAVAIGAVALTVHDRRVSRETRAACVAEHVLAARDAELAAIRGALEKAALQLKDRHAALQAQTEDLNRLEADNARLRSLSPDPDRPVFAADDPWLQRSKRPTPDRPGVPRR